MNSPTSTLISPATTCSSNSSFPDASIEANETSTIVFDDIDSEEFDIEESLNQFENLMNNLSQWNDGAGESDNEYESAEEELFWKEYELMANQFCLSVSNQCLSSQVADLSGILTKDTKWDLFKGISIFRIFQYMNDYQGKLKDSQYIQKNLSEQLEREKERCGFYQSQVKFYRDKTRDLEWKLVDLNELKLQDCSIAIRR